MVEMNGQIKVTHARSPIIFIINFSLLLRMAVSALRAAAAVPSSPLARGKSSNNRSPDEILLAQKDFQMQARVKIEHRKLIGHVSRRDAISLVSATVLSNLIASDAAEARRIKPETRKKIREKLDKLREEGGTTKGKTNSNAGNKEPEPFSPLKSASIPLVEAAV